MDRRDYNKEELAKNNNLLIQKTDTLSDLKRRLGEAKSNDSKNIRFISKRMIEKTYGDMVYEHYVERKSIEEVEKSINELQEEIEDLEYLINYLNYLKDFEKEE